MASVIVQYEVPSDGHHEVLELGPGEQVALGRGSADVEVGLRIDEPGVPRLAGRVAAAGDHWFLSNLSRDRTYLVENPEGAGEHVKVPPRRLDAPIPFEMSRVVIPVEGGAVQFVVFAPEHRFADPSATAFAEGETTAAAFSLDETAKYFLVLVALCEPRLLDGSSVALPTDPQIVQRLRPLPSCRDLTRSAVNFHIEYLAGTKLRLRESPAQESRRAALVAFSLRFDLVRDDHLGQLPHRSGSKASN